MPINTITTNYSGRTRDVHILRGATPLKRGSQPITLQFGKVSSFCAGIEKLVQRYVIMLLTNIDSQFDTPTFGTYFYSSLMQSGRVSSTADVQHIFNFANELVVNLFKEYQRNNKDLPLDEQIDTAILKNINVNGDKVSLSIQIYSLAGDTISFVLPLPES